MLRSTDKKDQQFVNMHRIRQAQRYGVNVGFRSFQPVKIQIEPGQEITKLEHQ